MSAVTTPPTSGPVESLAQYHPLIIEGMGGYDPRDPEPIAALIVSQLRDRWQAQPPTKPVILVTQGDPIEAHGISAITRSVAEKDQQREREGKAPLQSYYRDFALLQEVTKAACRSLCGEITVAHTSSEISPFSVTSFYEVGLKLGLMTADQIMPYHARPLGVNALF